MVIIFDDSIETSEDLTMIDDGTGFDIKIPSILIEYEHGKFLYEYILKQDIKNIFPVIS
jgi:hypothetical protein